MGRVGYRDNRPGRPQPKPDRNAGPGHITLKDLALDILFSSVIGGLLMFILWHMFPQ